jgi:hypothetical protein
VVAASRKLAKSILRLSPSTNSIVEARVVAQFLCINRRRLVHLARECRTTASIAQPSSEAAQRIDVAANDLGGAHQQDLSQRPLPVDIKRDRPGDLRTSAASGGLPALGEAMTDRVLSSVAHWRSRAWVRSSRLDRSWLLWPEWASVERLAALPER